MCHIEKATQVHHLTYARIFFEEPEDLIAVCASCHFQLHKDDGMPKGPLEATT
jgi:predicted HNH restriction endonuclease